MTRNKKQFAAAHKRDESRHGLRHLRKADVESLEFFIYRHRGHLHNLMLSRQLRSFEAFRNYQKERAEIRLVFRKRDAILSRVLKAPECSLKISFTQLPSSALPAPTTASNQ